MKYYIDTNKGQMQKDTCLSWYWVWDTVERAGHAKADLKLGLHILSIMCATLIFSLDNCWADVRIINKVEYYPVADQTLHSILLRIQEHSPFAGEQAYGTPFTVAYTKFSVDWEYTLHSDHKTCWMEDLEIDGEIRVILPKHTDITLMSKDEHSLWVEYLGKVIRHEKFHQESAVATAYHLESSLQQLPTQKTCAALHEELENTADAILFNYHRKQEQYDNITYGEQQGTSSIVESPQ